MKIEFNRTTSQNLNVYIDESCKAYFLPDEFFFLKKVPKITLFLIILLSQDNEKDFQCLKLYNLINIESYKKYV